MNPRTLCTSLCAVVCLTCACASTGKDPRVGDFAAEAAPEPAPTPLPIQRARFDPKEFASGFPRANECESAARSLQTQAPDSAWAALKECVDHNNFTLLRTLTSGAWDRDLQARQDASLVVANATRGGDVEGDLAVLRKRKVPVFSLAATLSSPQHYHGQLVVVRARVAKTQPSLQGKPAILVEEVALGSDMKEVETGPGLSSSSWGTERATATFSSQREKQSTAVEGSYSSGHRSYFTERRAENSTADTGRSAIVRLQKPDPFLESGREFVFLARFDGVRGTSTGDQGSPSALISLIAYFEPSPLVIE